MKYILFVALTLYVTAKTLEDRVSTLERNMEACCTTDFKPFGADSDLELVIRLRQRINNLEERVRELERESK